LESSLRERLERLQDHPAAQTHIAAIMRALERAERKVLTSA
jgi:hypothetical protein